MNPVERLLCRVVTGVVDFGLRQVGLVRAAKVVESPFKSANITFSDSGPVQVDLTLKTGQRVAGAVDPYYPNRPPKLLWTNNPIFPKETR